MARATISSKEVDKVVTVKETVKTVILELTEAEAKMLANYTGAIINCNSNGQLISNIYQALTSSGIRHSYTHPFSNVGGGLMMKDAL